MLRIRRPAQAGGGLLGPVAAKQSAGLFRYTLRPVRVRFPAFAYENRPRLGVCFHMERMRGIEPPLSAWEAGVLPMNYIRVYGKYSTERKKNQSLFRRIFSSGSAEEQRQDKIVLSMVRRANAPLIFTTSSTIFNHRTVAE